MRGEWVEFLETLFPCSRIVLNLRRDRAAQAQGILDSFFDTNADPLSAPPRTRIQKELEAVSQFMLEWHGNRSRLGRSFLMYTEDMDAQRFTELAQWLGQPCTFHSAPNANEYDPKDAQPYFHHSKTVDVACTSEPPPQLEKAPEPPSEHAPRGEHPSAYERLAHELEETCSPRVELPPNSACVPKALLEPRVERSQPGLIAMGTGNTSRLKGDRREVRVRVRVRVRASARVRVRIRARVRVRPVERAAAAVREADAE